jgi:hypothetical protein
MQLFMSTTPAVEHGPTMLLETEIVPAVATQPETEWARRKRRREEKDERDRNTRAVDAQGQRFVVHMFAVGAADSGDVDTSEVFGGGTVSHGSTARKTGRNGQRSV